MDAETLENWRKVKAALEAAGKTNCDYYRRAAVILRGQPDPWRPVQQIREQSAQKRSSHGHYFYG